MLQCLIVCCETTQTDS